MVFNYVITIYEKDNTVIVKPDMLSDVLKLDESLDSGIMTIPRLERKKIFKRFSKVKIETYEGESLEETVYYLIYNAKREIGQKGTTKKYNHTIALIEPTKWLEKFVIGTKTFTQKLSSTRYTFGDVLDIIQELAPIKPFSVLSTTRLFEYDTTFYNKVKDLEIPQQFIDKKNLREIFIVIFKTINVIPRMYYDSGWYVTGDFINKNNLGFDLEEEIIDYQQEAFGEDFGFKAQSFTENVIVDDKNKRPSLFAASITEFISVRSDNIIVGESNFKLILDNKMNRLIKLEISAYDNSVSPVDITSRCYTKDVYDTLDYDSGVGTQSNSCYWEYKQNYIDGLNETFGIFGTDMSIETLFTGTLTNIDDYLFRVVYEPFIETDRTEQYRIDIEDFELDSEMLSEESSLIMNIDEKLNDIHDLSTNIFGRIQRIGVDTISISKKHYTIKPYHPTTNSKGIYSLGDYTEDNYKVTVVEKVRYKSFVIARYELSKNWNRLAQFIQVDKEFRPYEISLTKSNFTLKRDITIPLGSFEIDKVSTQGTLTTQERDLKDKFMKTLALSVSSTDKHYTAIALQFSASNTITGIDAVYKPLMLLGEKNLVKFKLDFNDTKIAGSRIKVSTVAGNRVLQRKIVPYTDDSGYAKLYRFYFYENYTEPIASTTSLYDMGYYLLAKDFPKIEINVEQKRVYFGNSFINAYENVLANIVEDFETLEEIFGVAGQYYLDDDSKNLYTKIGDSAPELIQKIALQETEPNFITPEYALYKDPSEVLGISFILPILVNKDLIDNIIIGEQMVKENFMIGRRTYRVADNIKAITFKTRSYKFSQFDTSYLADLTATSEAVTVTDNDYISVPSNIYTNNDYYAIVDSDNMSYVAVNQRNADGTKTTVSRIYFNFNQSFNNNAYHNVVAGLILDLDLQATVSFALKNITANLALELDLQATAHIVDFLLASASMNLGLNLNAIAKKINVLLASASMNVSVNLYSAALKGYKEYESSNETYYNSASSKSTVYIDRTDSALPDVYSYDLDHALRVYLYNLGNSNETEYNASGNQVDLIGAYYSADNEDVEFILQDDTTAYADFIAGTFDGVIKVDWIDGPFGATTSYYVASYPLKGYYKVIFTQY
jgi:hypothetical protein